MSVAEFRQVQWQIVLADIMERADDATLQQAPKAIQVRSVDVSTHIFALGMAHGLMRELSVQSGITAMFIGRHKRDTLTDRIPHKVAQGHAVSILDDLADHVSLSGDCPDDGYFIFSATMIGATLVCMAIAVFAPDVGLIDLHFSHELGKASILHGRSDAVAHIPGGSIRPTANDALNLKGTNPLLAAQHQVNDLEPRLQRVVGILKDRLRNHGKAVAVPSAAILALADPVIRTALDRKHLGVLATWACHAIRPTTLLQESLAGVFRFKSLHQAAECLRFHDLASVMLRLLYRSSIVVSSRA